MANIELPKDAEGREIPLDTDVLYSSNGFQNNIRGFLYRSKGISIKDRWIVVFANGIERFAFQMHLTQPDSWEKLEKDLGRGADALNYEACAYFGKIACDCSSCIADKGETCERVAMRDIADRIRKLRGEGK